MGEYYHTQKPHIFRLQPYFKLIKLLGQIFSAFSSKKFSSLPTYFLSHCLPLFSSFPFHFFLLIMQKYLSSSALKTNWKWQSFLFFNWNTADVQHNVSFRCTTLWLDICIRYEMASKSSNHLSHTNLLQYYWLYSTTHFSYSIF